MKGFPVRAKVPPLETHKEDVRFVTTSRHLRPLGSRLNAKPLVMNLKITAVTLNITYLNVKYMTRQMSKVQHQISITGLNTIGVINAYMQEMKKLNQEFLHASFNQRHYFDEDWVIAHRQRRNIIA